MEQLKFTQTELREMLMTQFSNYGGTVKKLTFDTRLDANELPVIAGCMTQDENGAVTNWDRSDMSIMISDYLTDRGHPVDFITDSVKYTMRTMRTPSDKIVPVFKGCVVNVQEKDLDAEQTEFKKQEHKPKAKPITLLVDTRRSEQAKSLSGLEDRDLLEAVRAHFESHPTLPGEKAMKEAVNKLLEQEGDIKMETGQLDDIIEQYASTRMRDTKIASIGNQFSLTDLKSERIDQYGDDSVVSVHKADVELQKSPSGDVYVLAGCKDGRYETIGKLPDKFLTNNPMNVDSCDAELQIADYSNGGMKNVSMRVIADTDLMSGDVIDLDEDMFMSLNQDTGLEQ